jgi:hypothetical protein
LAPMRPRPTIASCIAWLPFGIVRFDSGWLPIERMNGPHPGRRALQC